ncbi:DinB family protein [Cytobacillus spongiae]|uniref:DinB family protein n=1 Tax=Cytobacillus spongiae TaxID=2901381 RepID=UPI001F423CB6|nr:DinB family protein [Cytobacillus spongiae]UII56432.1 DinB family protein [Cytobacillus spongiae]
MNQYKKEILEHFFQTIEYVQSLRTLTEEEWRKPIGMGKWTVAELIGHFIPWDDFVLEQRIPYILLGEDLPVGSDVKETNERGAQVARQEAQQTTIDRYTTTRTALYQALADVADKQWENSFTIGTRTLSFYEYCKGLAEHDQHHFKQLYDTING